MILYHIDFVSSVTGVFCRFFHTDYQSVNGQSLVIRISRGSVSACSRIIIVSHTRRFYNLDYYV
jgi:hypothetical protein